MASSANRRLRVARLFCMVVGLSRLALFSVCGRWTRRRMQPAGGRSSAQTNRQLAACQRCRLLIVLGQGAFEPLEAENLHPNLVAQARGNHLKLVDSLGGDRIGEMLDI